MVRVLAIGDLHFKKDHPDLADLVIGKLTLKIKEASPDMIVFLGDILDTHERMDMNTFNKAVKFFKTLAQKYAVVLIMGNHDRPGPTEYLSENSAFYALNGFPNIHVVDRVINTEFGSKGPDGSPAPRFIFVPYVPTGKFMDALDTLNKGIEEDKDNIQCIFCHQTFVGATYSKTVVRSGDKWPSDYPLVISGHIHKHKIVQENLIYAGTPYQIAFDDDSDKGILLLQWENGKRDIRFIDTEIRRKKAITLKPSELDSFVPPDNCEVRVEIIGSRAEIEDLTKKGIITKIRSKGVYISMIPDENTNTRNPEGKTMRQILLDSIKDDKHAIQIYEELFTGQETSQEEVKESVAQEMANLLNLEKTMNIKSGDAGPAISTTNQMAEITEAPQYSIDAHGRPVQNKPTTADIQASMSQSAKEKTNKSAEVSVQSILEDVLRNK